MPVDLATWTVSDVVGACAGVRACADGAESMEQAAGRIVRLLRQASVDPATGASSVVLARLFKTEDSADLPADVAVPQGTDGRCLVLLATDGDLPEWRDRHSSRSHQAIRLDSEQAVAAAPMLAAVVRELGMDVGVLLGRGRPASGREDLDVFHVEEALGSPQVPDQDFVARHGVRSVVGLGGLLPTGHVFVLLLFVRTTVTAELAGMLRSVAVSAKLALLPLVSAPVFSGSPPRSANEPLVAQARLAALEQLLEVEEQAVAEQDRALRREAEIIETLHVVGESLSSELELERVVARAAGAGVEVTGAQVGAFVFETGGGDQARELAVVVAGQAPAGFAEFAVASHRARLAGGGTEVTHPQPHPASPGVVAPMRSFLALPVPASNGNLHGGLFFGHESTGAFDRRAYRLAAGIASQAAAAMDNAGLYRRERNTALELQRALLPRDIAPPPGLQVRQRYVPGTVGVEVGGDWYDVIPREDDSVLLVIGDVMGRGAQAAATMGQLRTATRALSTAGLSPAATLSRLSSIAMDIEDERIATCLVAVLDRATGGLTMANAGHLAPLISTGEGVAQLDVPTGPPLGVVIGGTYAETEHRLSPGTSLVLFTDGLVEHRHRSVDEGVRELSALLEGELRDDICDKLIDSMTGGRADDDVALLVVTWAGPT